MLMMVLCDREGRVYDVWISFGSVHVGFAIQKLDPDYALESLRLFDELLEEEYEP